METFFKLFCVILLYSTSGFSQSYNTGIDYEHIFKNWIYIEKKSNVLIDKDNLKTLTVKNDSIYDLFITNIELKISDKKNNLPNNFVVKQLIIDEKNIKNNSELTPYTLSTRSFSYTYQCQGALALIFDLKTGISYRIMGFNGNDTLSFIQDLRKYLREIQDENYSEKKITNTFFIEGVDMKCILKGLKSKNEKDTNRFPCLKSCLGELITE